MSFDTLIALMGFAFVMSISPGPANFLLLVSGANFGYMRSLPLVLGVSMGFLTMVFFGGLGLGQVLKSVPAIYIGLKFVCAAYVLWLAIKIARSRSMGSSDDDEMATPISFVQGALFQLVNPKAWAVALILSVSYTDPKNFLPSLIFMIIAFAVVNLPAISVWAISGAAIRGTLEGGRRIAIFNTFMALLLVASMVPVLFGFID